MTRRRTNKQHTEPQRPASRVADASPIIPQRGSLTPAKNARYDASVELCEPTMSVRTTDAFSNQAARTGFDTPNLLQSTEYPLTRLTQNYQLLNSLYRGNWIVQNIIDKIPEDMTKNWYKILSQASPEQLDKIKKCEKSIRLRAKILQGLKWGRLYGGAGGLILIEGHEKQLAEPLDLNTILPGTFRGLHIVDRWSGLYPDGNTVSDIADPEFGLPEFYQVRNDADTVVERVHHSRLIRFAGRLLPYWESVAELGWGASEIESVYSEIVKRDNVSENIAALTFRANISVYEIDGLDQMYGLGSQDAQKRFWAMMQAQSIAQSNFGVQLINRGDKFDTRQYTFTGLADVYNNIMCDVAGAANIPVSKLFGRSPAGLNSTGEGDLQNYYDHIEQKQEADLSPIIDKLLPILAVSALGEIPDDLDYVFNPIRAANVSDRARIAEFKEKAVSDVWQVGLIDKGTAMKELREMAEDTGMFTNITDEQIAAATGVTFAGMQEEANAIASPVFGPPSQPVADPKDNYDRS
jgi:phage-related protein (TIGR01555 family)